MAKIKVKKADKVSGDKSLFISFNYNQSLVDAIRAYPERAWHQKTKEWEVPLVDLSFVLDDFYDQKIEITGEYVDMSPREEVTEIDFDFKTIPFNHQKEAFIYGMNHDKWLLGDEQGLGKTKQSIDIAVALKKKRGYKHCLIICGVNGLKWNWYNEVSKHSNETAHILGQKIRKRTGNLTVGGNKAKQADLESLLNDPGAIESYFIITNVESFRSKDIVSICEKLVDNFTIEMIIIDECHKCIKENINSSQQGKGILKLQPEYRLALTGTPLMNSPLDLYGILRWLGFEKHSFYQFKKHYAEMGGYGGYEVVGYKHLDELSRQFNSIKLRRLKDDVLDLPDKLCIDEYVDMLPKQAVLYREIKAEIKMNIDMISVSPNPLAQMIRMRQATGYTGILSSSVQCSAKLDRMEEIIQESLENKRQIVIFSNWTDITDAVHNRLHDKYPLSMITGNVADDERQANIDAFQNGDTKIIIGTTGAMGTGLTLTAGKVVIFLDEPWSKALKDQAEDRVHRIGQNNNVTIYTIMCKGTIDERIHNIVEKKGKMSDVIIDGKEGKITKEIVEYLIG